MLHYSIFVSMILPKCIQEIREDMKRAEDLVRKQNGEQLSFISQLRHKVRRKINPSENGEKSVKVTSQPLLLISVYAVVAGHISNEAPLEPLPETCSQNERPRISWSDGRPLDCQQWKDDSCAPADQQEENDLGPPGFALHRRQSSFRCKALEINPNLPTHIILDCTGVNYIDVMGIDVLEQVSLGPSCLISQSYI